MATDRFEFSKGESEVSWYRSSPWIRWGFCRTCGSSIFYVADKEGHLEAPRLEHMYVSVGSLTSDIPDKPVDHVSYEERVPWHETSDTLPKYRGKTDERVS